MCKSKCSLSGFIKWSQLVLVLLCAIAFITALFFYGSSFKHYTNNVVIEYIISTDSLGVVSAESKELADSLISELQKHERMLEDKYQYFIEQQSNTQDLFTIGGILLGVIVSLVGFFGYSTMQSIEEKANVEAKNAADQAFNKTIQSLQENHSKQYWEGTIKPEVDKKIEEAKNLYWGNTSSQVERMEIDIVQLKDAVSNIDKKINNRNTTSESVEIRHGINREPDVFSESN